MSVLYVYKYLYDNNSIEIELTNQNTKCVWRNTPEFNVKYLCYGDKGTIRTCRLIRDKNDKKY